MFVELVTDKPGPVNRKIGRDFHLFEEHDEYEGLVCEIPDDKAIKLVNQVDPSINRFVKAENKKTVKKDPPKTEKSKSGKSKADKPKGGKPKTDKPKVEKPKTDKNSADKAVPPANDQQDETGENSSENTEEAGGKSDEKAS